MSAILDTIRPYLAVIRVVLWCALAGGIFVGGCRYGVGQGAEKLRVAQDQRDTAITQLDKSNATLAEVNRATQRNLDAAAEAKNAAERAATDAAIKAQAAKARAAKADAALVKAKADPDCAKQLEVTLCPLVPLL